mgnify:FL=1
MINSRSIFHNLFVLELANNHLGSIKRGKKIISDYGHVVRFNNVKAAIKLQFRDMDNFIHESYKDLDLRYIKKTQKTLLNKKEYKILVDFIKKNDCIPMATPFDEKSVDLCEEFNFPIIKIASSDCNDWPLIEKVTSTRKPVIISTGGVTEKDLDDVVKFFKKRKIDLAINHCVSLYPSEDNELVLNQIDYLKNRFPENIIGFSTHEYNDWSSSMLISYAKGARTWERHIDVEYENVSVSKYNSLPHQIDTWFKSFHKAVEMCGTSSEERRIISKSETEYLDKLVRGVYAKKDLKSGLVINNKTLKKNFYLSIPLQKGQLSCREILDGEILIKPLKKGKPLNIEYIDSPYSKSKELKDKIKKRGIKI